MPTSSKTKQRIVTTVVISILLATALVYFAYQYRVVPHFHQLERQAAAQHLQRVLVNFDIERNNLEALLHDYTVRVGRYEHLEQQDDEFWHHAFPDELFSNHGLSDVAVYSMDGALLFSKGYDLTRQQRTGIDVVVGSHLLQQALRHPKQQLSGVLPRQRQVALVAAHPIHTTVEQCKQGMILFCRPLNQQVISHWSRLFRLDLQLLRLPRPDSDRLAYRALNQLGPQQPISIQIATAGQLQVFSLIQDLTDQPLALLKLTLPRQHFLATEQNVATSLGLLLVGLLLVTFFMVTRLRRIQLQPFIALTNRVHQLRKLDDQGALPPSKGTEELTEEINALLSDLTQSRLNQNAIQVQTDLIKRVVPCAIFTVDNKRIITSWNDCAEQLTGYSAQEMVGSSCFRFAQAPCNERCRLFDPKVEKPVMGRECTIRCKNGNVVTITKNAELLHNSQGDVIGGIECFIDISPHKKNEQALQWEMALNTRLTSLALLMLRQDVSHRHIATELLEQTRILTGSTQGFVAHCDGSGKQQLWAHTELFDHFSPANSPATIPAAASGRGSLLHAVYNRKTGVYFNDLDRLNVTHLAGGIQKPLSHFMAVPIVADNQIFGQVALANNGEGYTLTDLQAVEQLAELFAVLLQQHDLPTPMPQHDRVS